MYIRNFGDGPPAIMSLISQIKQIITSAPPSIQPQLNAILQRQTTSGPSQTVQGAIDWYTKPSVGSAPGPWASRDQTLLQTAYNDMSNIVQQAQLSAAPTTASMPSITMPNTSSASSTSNTPITNASLTLPTAKAGGFLNHP